MTAQRTIDQLFERFYSKSKGYGSATIRFHELCRSNIPPGGSILEIGAGPTNGTTNYLASVGEVTGLDVGNEVLSNRALTTAHLFDGRNFPFGDSQFDACVSNYVLEHVADPQTHFNEVARVLKRGGAYIIRTPNLLHYVALASSMLPHSVHVRFANRLRNLSPETHDPWPTVYRANRLNTLRGLAARAGLEAEQLLSIECEPSYARNSVLLFFPMMLYERAVNMSPLFAGFRASISAVFRKP
jgi:SAM-dependent methyltransferase